MLKKIKIILCSLFLIVFLTTFCACSSSSTNSANTGKNADFQTELPSQGEDVAIMETSKGTIKIRFFPEQAPKAVENFISLSKSGYYNGITFHRVIQDFMIQGGDPTATGSGGQSTWGTAFEDEFSADLLNITGSLSMANSGKNTNGSQFFINYNPPEKFKGWDYFNQYWTSYKQYYDAYYKSQPERFESLYGSAMDMTKVTDSVKKAYETYGGNPTLDGYYSAINKGHTVFGQVYEGLDIVKAIDYVETDDNDKPKENVVINNISIVPYEG